MSIVLDYLSDKSIPLMTRRNLVVRMCMIVCKDGFNFSCQRSPFHYCDLGDYTPSTYDVSLELGFLSEPEEYVEAYSIDGQVYGYVPYYVVDELITKHGGLECYKLTETSN